MEMPRWINHEEMAEATLGRLLPLLTENPQTTRLELEAEVMRTLDNLPGLGNLTPDTLAAAEAAADAADVTQEATEALREAGEEISDRIYKAILATLGRQPAQMFREIQPL